MVGYTFIKADRSPNLYKFIHVMAMEEDAHSELRKASNSPSVPSTDHPITPSPKQVRKITILFAEGVSFHYSVSA